MWIWYYAIMLILSFINLGIFLAKKKKQTSSLFTGLFILLAVCNIAHFLAAISKNGDEYIALQKIIYIGAIFLPYVTLLIVMNFINFKYLKQVLIIAGIITVSFYTLILTIGFNDLYYVSWNFEITQGIAEVTKVYGKLHFLYYVYMATYVLTFIGLFINGFLKKNVSYKSLLYLVGLIVLSIISSVVGRMSLIDITPFVYVVSGILMILLVVRTEKYNVDYMASISQENELYYGLIAIDENKHYLGSSPKVLDILPEMKMATVDFSLPKGHIFDHINELIAFYNDGKHDKFINCERDGIILKFSITEFKYSKKKSGYIIEITNDTKRAEYINKINNYNETLAKEVEAKTKNIRDIQYRVTLSMANLIETRDDNTGGHVKRTSDIIEYILNSAKKLHVYEMDDDFYNYVKRSAPMHDLGKISISNDILNKPGRFTPEEFEIMKTHSAMGESYVRVILEGVENERFVTIARNVARYHHEKYGGGGYPDNLKGDEIPLEARLMALADVYDALVSKRVYKERMSFSKASEIIYESMGPHFDPKLKIVFDDCREQLEAYYMENDNE